MRHTLLILLASLFALAAHAQDTLDFSHFKWGTPLSIMREHYSLRLLREQGATKRYSSDVSSIGDAELNDCQFEFTDGRFSGIAATTPGKADSDKLLRWLKSRFGPGESREPLGWQWFSGDTHIWFDMARAGEGWLYWYSLAMQQARERP